MKQRKEKSPRIGSAVIRGRKERYEFEVFPLDVEMQPVPAVYVISRRVIDREGRGHHKFVCIGETESLALELKKHKKGKCLKKFRANVISVLPTESEKTRFSIAADLKAAHSIPCLHEPDKMPKQTAAPALKPKIEKKSAQAPLVSTKKTAKPTAEKAERKIARKIEIAKPPVITEKSKQRVKAEPAKDLKQKPVAKAKAEPAKIVKVESLKKVVKATTAKGKLPEKTSTGKTAKTAEKAPVLKKKDSAKKPIKAIKKPSTKAGGAEALKSKEQVPASKPKTVTKQPAQKSAVKTAKASNAGKAASKIEQKNLTAKRKAVAAGGAKRRTETKTKAAVPKSEVKTKRPVGGKRKRLAI